MGWLMLFALLLTGCSHTNIAELVKELAADPNANCIQFNAGPYGSVLVARGTPNANVRMGPGQCEILGSNVTTVTVPASSIIVNPQYLQGHGQGQGTH